LATDRPYGVTPPGRSPVRDQENSRVTSTVSVLPQQRATRLPGLGDAIFGGLAWGFALLVLVLLTGVIVSLVWGALPALRTYGFDFLVSTHWNPVTEKFGALPAIYGTLVTSVIAMLIAVPTSFGISIFLTELCPPFLKRSIGTAIELLAAVPSIIFGIWGLFVLAPIMQTIVQPALTATLGQIPLIGLLFSGAPYGIGILTAGIILSIMVLPYMVSITRDVFETVPAQVRESAYGLGATTWEVVWRVILPYSRVGVIGAFMLSLGRALGETMAVTFVVGNTAKIAASITQPGTTISAALANEFAEASDELHLASLLGLGLILFLLTFTVIGTARLLLLRLNKQFGGH
jgi:phosphate transport system permease protein